MTHARSAPRPYLRRLAVILPLLLLHGCGEAGEDDAEAGREETVIVDDAGARHRLDVPPLRIVSLVPSSTEILRALGAEARLVGRTDFDTAAALASIPSVGGGLHPSLEAILVLDPDFVIRFSGEQDQATPRRLSEVGIPHFAVRPDGIDDVRRIIRSLATLLAMPERGDSLVAGIDRELLEVAARVQGREPIRVVYVTGGSPPWVAGSYTFIDELITIAGGENVFGDLGSFYAPVSLEELALRDIDLVLLPRGSRNPIGSRAPGAEVSPLTLAPGPRLAEAAREIARILHPDAFAEDGGR